MNAAQQSLTASWTGPHDERYFAMLAELEAAEHVNGGKVSAQTPYAEWAETIQPPAPKPPSVSAQPRNEEWAERKLPFRTAREVAVSAPEQVPWRCRGFAARGAITELDAKVKTGKTELIAHLVAAITEGRPFLGQPTEQTRVVYLSEQNATTFREALRRAGLLESDAVSVLFWSETLGLSWSEVVTAAVAECKRQGAGVLIVDTLGRFAGLTGDGENAAADADRIMAPLQVAAAEHDLCIIVARHERKSGGDVGDSGRGSSAFSGAADIVLALRRGEGQTRPTVRVIHGLSRFDETPDTLVVELTEDGYIALGDETAVALHETRDAIAEVLPSEEDAALTMQELQAALKGRPRSTVQRAVEMLEHEGAVRRTGAGKRADPFRFLSAQTSLSSGAETFRLRPEYATNDG